MDTGFAMQRLNRRTLAAVAGSAAIALAGWQGVAAQQAGAGSQGFGAAANADGITVTGSGVAEGEVERGLLQFLVRYGPGSTQSQGSAGGSEYYYGSNVPAPDEDALANVVNAIVDGGVDRERILIAEGSESVYGMFGPGVSVVAAELDAAAIATMEDMIENATAAGIETELSFDQVGVIFYAVDCDSVSDAAYLAAIEDGRVQAESVARALGVELGELTGVTAYTPWSAYSNYSGGGAGNGCSQSIELESALTTYFPSFVPGVEPTFSLTVSVSLTFAFASE